MVPGREPASSRPGAFFRRKSSMGASTMRGLLLASAVVLSGSVANAEEGTAQKARQFLEKHCARCHAGGQDEGGLDCALDGRRLVETKRVVPGHAGDSELFRLVSTKKVTDDTETKPTDDEVADLKRWIDEGAPAFGATAAFVSPEQVLATIKADVLALDKADRPFARYLTLVHLANAGRSPDEIVAHTKALSKLLNGLSWKKEIAVPTAVGAEKTILRIDLRKYDWTAATWQAIAAAYPYGTVPEGVAKDCAAETGSESFAIRGDWFLANVARPPLYHAILQLPGTDKEIEKLLGV